MQKNCYKSSLKGNNFNKKSTDDFGHALKIISETVFFIVGLSVPLDKKLVFTKITKHDS